MLSHTFWKSQSIVMMSLLWMGLSLDSLAQTNAAKVQAIEKVYQQARINISRKAWRENNYTINLKRHNLNHSGYYHYSEKLYYFIPSNKKKPRLQLALVRREKENIDYQKEFLFSDKGDLIYFHEKQNDVKNLPYREVKVYFQRGKLLVWNQNNQNSMQVNVIQDVQKPKQKIAAILKEAKALQKKLTRQLEEM